MLTSLDVVAVIIHSKSVIDNHIRLRIFFSPSLCETNKKMSTNKRRKMRKETINVISRADGGWMWTYSLVIIEFWFVCLMFRILAYDL